MKHSSSYMSQATITRHPNAIMAAAGVKPHVPTCIRTEVSNPYAIGVLLLPIKYWKHCLHADQQMFRNLIKIVKMPMIFVLPHKLSMKIPYKFTKNSRCTKNSSIVQWFFDKKLLLILLSIKLFENFFKNLMPANSSKTIFHSSKICRINSIFFFQIRQLFEIFKWTQQ